MDAHRSRVLFLSTPAETSESQGSQCAGACALPADDLRASTHGIRPSHHKQSSASPPKPQQTWQWEPKNQSTALTSSCARVPGLRCALPDSGTESASRDGEGQCQVVLPWGPELSYLCPSGVLPSLLPLCLQGPGSLHLRRKYPGQAGRLCSGECHSNQGHVL